MIHLLDTKDPAFKSTLKELIDRAGMPIEIYFNGTPDSFDHRACVSFSGRRISYLIEGHGIGQNTYEPASRVALLADILRHNGAFNPGQSLIVVTDDADLGIPKAIASDVSDEWDEAGDAAKKMPEASAAKIGRSSLGCEVALVAVLVIFVLLVVGVVIGLKPRHLSEEDPRKVFGSLICSPVPATVTDIKASGTLALASSGATISFEIDPRDRDDLIERGRFSMLPQDEVEKWGDPFREQGGSDAYAQAPDPPGSMTEAVLFLQKSGNRCTYYRVEF